MSIEELTDRLNTLTTRVEELSKYVADLESRIESMSTIDDETLKYTMMKDDGDEVTRQSWTMAAPKSGAFWNGMR